MESRKRREFSAVPQVRLHACHPRCAKPQARFCRLCLMAPDPPRSHERTDEAADKPQPVLQTQRAAVNPGGRPKTGRCATHAAARRKCGLNCPDRTEALPDGPVSPPSVAAPHHSPICARRLCGSLDACRTTADLACRALRRPLQALAEAASSVALGRRPRTARCALSQRERSFWARIDGASSARVLAGR